MNDYMYDDLAWDFACENNDVEACREIEQEWADNAMRECYGDYDDYDDYD